MTAECCESFAGTDVRGKTIPDSRTCRAKTSSTNRPPIGHSDHCIVNFVLAIKECGDFSKSGHKMPIERSYNWHNANFDSIAQCLHYTDWNALICYNPSASSSWHAFIQFLWSIIPDFVPKFSDIRNTRHSTRDSETFS